MAAAMGERTAFMVQAKSAAPGNSAPFGPRIAGQPRAARRRVAASGIEHLSPSSLRVVTPTGTSEVGVKMTDDMANQIATSPVIAPVITPTRVGFFRNWATKASQKRLKNRAHDSIKTVRLQKT